MQPQNKLSIAAIYIPRNGTDVAFCLVFIVLLRLEWIHSHSTSSRGLQREADNYERATSSGVCCFSYQKHFARSVISHMNSRDKVGEQKKGSWVWEGVYGGK